MNCVYCNMSMHGLCVGEDESEICCCKGRGFQSEAEQFVQALSGKRGPGRPRKTLPELEPAVRKPKSGEAMVDPTSTGRKRAAVRISREFLESKPVCAWAGLLFAGGGPKPIVGCVGNIATDRHHGPDKSVLNNDDALPTFGTNLHAICDWCHNRWHAVNDRFYLPDGWKKGDPDRPEGGRPWLPNIRWTWRPHDPETKASPDIIKAHEAWWGLETRQREALGMDFHEYAKRSKFAVGESAESSQPVGLSSPLADSPIGARPVDSSGRCRSEGQEIPEVDSGPVEG